MASPVSNTNTTSKKKLTPSSIASELSSATLHALMTTLDTIKAYIIIIKTCITVKTATDIWPYDVQFTKLVKVYCLVTWSCPGGQSLNLLRRKCSRKDGIILFLLKCSSKNCDSVVWRYGIRRWIRGNWNILTVFRRLSFRFLRSFSVNFSVLFFFQVFMNAHNITFVEFAVKKEANL